MPDSRPHSRACGWRPHEHGAACHPNCPTCHGVPEDEVLPCGCLIRAAVIEGVNTLTISPCHLDCPNLANALDLARGKGIAPEYRRA